MVSPRAQVERGSTLVQVVMLVHEENGVFGASFPDIPGCTTVARDLDTLYGKAAEVLSFHLAGMAEDGLPLPAPRGLAELRADPVFREDLADAALVGFVSADMPGGRAVRLNITLDEATLERVDRAARASGQSRSGYLAAAARLRMGQEREDA